MNPASTFTTGRSVFYDPLTGAKRLGDMRFEMEKKLVACLATGGTHGYPLLPHRITNAHFRSLALEGMSKTGWSVSDLTKYGGNLDGAAALALIATLEKPTWGQSDFLVWEAIERMEQLQESAWRSGLAL